MTLQPTDVPVHCYNHGEFNDLDGILTLFTYSQPDNTKLNDPSSGEPSSPPPESLALNDLKEISTENVDSIETSMSEQEPAEGIFGETSLMDPSHVPTNEVTITTTVSENDTTSKTDLIPDVDEPTTDKVHLDFVDGSNQEQLISVISHPTNDPRRRYQSEGKRRDKKRDSDPWILDLSKLKKYKFTRNQSLWLRLSLITASKNDDDPFDNVFIHSDKLKLFSGTIEKLIDGSICILITQSNIDEGKLELKDLAICKTLLKMYDFELISYSLSEIGTISEIYPINERKGCVANAKRFHRQYNLKASRIACQILLKEDQSWYWTQFVCVTNIINEQEYEPKATKPVKRLKKNNRKSGNKRRKVNKTKSAKRKTRS